MIEKINGGFGKIEITFVKNICIDVCLKEVHSKVNIDFNENKN